MEIGEIIAAPSPHTGISEECPFCPEEKPATFTTYPGSANNSSSLDSIMNEPSKLASLQSGARPKLGGENQQSPSEKQPKPTPIFEDPEEGPYSCEAHHLISGKQALEGHAFEGWTVKGKLIENDTGYSVNNADNGLWAPSIPDKYKGGNWGKLDFATKFAIAKKPMAAGNPQFHKGHHAISDPDDPDGIRHRKYDKYLKGMLTEMEERMKGWSQKCPLCDEGKNEKMQPSVRVNQVLDNLSATMRRKIGPPASKWDIFLSRYALEYHKPICPHGVEDM